MIPVPTPRDITIAVTVFDRESFIFEAVQSALDQSLNVKVAVVEDHGPNLHLRKNIMKKFGDRIHYHRNPQRRGLFGCWNECLEQCETEWISILHDDDYLYPDFVQRILETASRYPARGAYFCSHDLVDGQGGILQKFERPAGGLYKLISPREMTMRMQTLFPGQLIHVKSALKLGGFMETSLYCGDWDMWHRITCKYGAAQILMPLAAFRSHDAPLRGTSKILRSGKKRALEFVQIKRNLARVATVEELGPFCRSDLLSESPLSLKETLPWLHQLSPYMQKYLLGLLLLSKPPGFGYWLVKKTVELTGWRGWLFLGKINFLLMKRGLCS